MKNDYVSGAGLGPYASNDQNVSLQRPFAARLTNADRAALSRTFNRNQEYSTPRRNNYLQASGGQIIPTVNKAANKQPLARPDKLTNFEPKVAVTPPVNAPPHSLRAPASDYQLKSTTPKRQLLPLRELLIVVFAISVLVVSGAVFSASSSSPFSKQLASAVNIKLYYPAAIPSGYHVVNSSIKMTTSQSMFFEIADGKSIIDVSESQAEPPADTAKVMQTNFKDTSKVKSAYGSAVVGYQKTSPGVFGSLVSKDGSWIVATGSNTSKTIGAVAMIVASLKPAS